MKNSFPVGSHSEVRTRLASFSAPAWAAVFLLWSSACGIHVRPHDPTASGLPPTSPGVDPGAPPSTNPRTGGSSIQTTCRASSLPSAWVIIDYFESSECPALGGERYNGARIVRHATYPRDSEIVVCADQRVPKGWRRQGPVEESDFQYRCLSSIRTRSLSERVMRIRRL
jgi:hypothetical protein